MPTLRQLEQALVKADAAGDDRAARQIAAEIKRVRAQGAKPAPVSRTEAFVRGVERGMRPVGDVMQALDPVSNIVNYFFPSVEKKRAARQARLAKEAPRAAADRPGFFTGGKIAGEIAATAPLIATGGGAVAATGSRLARVGGQMTARGTTGGRAVQTVGRATQATGRAVQTGGMGVRAPSRTAVAGKAPIATTRKGRIGLRVGGGAGAGTAAAILTDQELTDAALGGAIIPVVGTIARRGAGFVYDTLRGRLGEVRAAEVMRNLIASNASAITNALRDAPADARANTAEFLASQGLLTPELAAATRIASASSQGAPLEQVARARAAGQEELRTALRGGETGTEAMQNIGAMRQQVAEATDPMREEALRLSDVGRTQILPAEQQAAALRASVQRELDAATQFVQDPNWSPSVAARLDVARSAEEVAANLRAQGLQPLDISGVVGNLRQRAADAEFVNPPRFRLLNEFANNLERRAATQGGVIDATGLYELRKSMADTVADLLGPMDPGALQRRTAELVGETKPLIDDAIEAAGGANWRQYLNTFAAGMQNVERQQFARALEKLPEARFEKVMSGQDPDFVSKFFGPGRFDINVELFGSQLPTAQRLAGELRAQRSVAATGQEALSPSQKLGFRAGAQSRVEEALTPGLTGFARGVLNVTGRLPGVSGGGVAAEQTAREISQQVAQNAMRRLVPGLASPQAASNLLAVRSANNRMAEFVNSLAPSVRAALGQALVQGQMGAVQPVPAAPALPEVDLPGGDMPFGNINYDEFGNYIGPRR
jgi:hypothetical protein